MDISVLVNLKQLCADTECSLENLQGAMDDRVWFGGTSTIVGYLMPNPFLHI